MYLEDIFTVQAYLIGDSAVSMPRAKHKNEKPIWIQTMERYFNEEKFLALSKHLMNNN